MTGALLGLEVRRSRMLVIWLTVVVLAYGGIIAAIYPIIRDNSALLEGYLKLFPKELLAAFGIQGSLADPGVFFTTYIGSWLWPIVAAIAAILLATRPVAADLDRGFLEVALATPVPRTRLLLAAISVQLGGVALLALATVAGVLVVGAIVGASFDAGRFLLVVPHAAAFGSAIAAVTAVLSVITLSRGTAAGLATGIIIAMYLVEIVAQIQPDLAWLGEVSAFHHFRVTSLIDSGAFPVADFLAFAAIAVAGWGAALALFRRRDLVA